MSDKQKQEAVPLPIEPHTSWLGLDDKTIGLRYWAWFITFVFEKWGVDLGEECSQKSYEQVLADHNVWLSILPDVALKLDQNDVEGVLLEKAAKLCVRNELSNAGGLVREFIENRADYEGTKA